MKLIEDYIHKANDYINTYGKKTVLLMQVGAFYEIYSLNDNTTTLYHNIHHIGDVTGLAVVEKSVCVGSQNVLAAGFKDNYIDKWVYKIQSNGYTCVIYDDQDSNCKNTTRSLSSISTPGTYIDMNCSDDNNRTNNNTCIWLERIRNKLYVGISNINIITGKSQMYEYIVEYTGIPNMYDDIERYISVYNPSETIIISNLSTSVITSILHYTNNHSITVKVIDLNDASDPNTIKAVKCESQSYQKQIFNTFFSINNINVFLEGFSHCAIATQSYCYLLNYLHIMNPYLIEKIGEPVIENLTERLILANHSAKQLNIIGDGNGKYSSVLEFTNNTLTAMGKRIHRETLLNPITNPVKLQNTYDITEHVMNQVTNQVTLVELLRNELSEIKDIEKITKLIVMQKLPIKNLYTLYKNFSNISTLCNIIKEHPELSYLQPEEISTCIVDIATFISSHIDIEKCKNIYFIEENIFHRGIYDDLDLIDEELQDSYKGLVTIVSKFDDLMNQKINPKKNTHFLKLHDTEKSGYSIQITKSRVPYIEAIIKDHQGEEFIWDFQSTFSKTNTDVTTDTTTDTINKPLRIKADRIQIHKVNTTISVVSPEIHNICKHNLQYKTDLKVMVNNKYIEFLSKLKLKTESLYKICNFTGLVDIMQNRAYIASKYNYCKPIIENNDISSFKTESLRHPLVEQINTDEIYVANDVSLGEDNILLFGTNAVGKTCLIKSIGIAIILAQSGFYVPAQSFKFTPYKELFTRILNCDNLFKGLSTFTLEMSEMANILKYATKHSLVLGDELCSGTELPSAMCIFISGLQTLSKERVSFIFATHFHELLDFPEIHQIGKLSYKHMSIEYDIEKDCIIYDRKLKDGSGDKIYGLEVCKSLHLPHEFMENAFNILNKYYKKDVLFYSKSKYNTSKIKSMCEICKENEGVHVHHLLYQQDAKNKFINETINSSIPMNHTANLINICEDCHHRIHDKDIRMVKRTTTKGIIIEEI